MSFSQNPSAHGAFIDSQDSCRLSLSPIFHTQFADVFGGNWVRCHCRSMGVIIGPLALVSRGIFLPIPAGRWPGLGGFRLVLFVVFCRIRSANRRQIRRCFAGSFQAIRKTRSTRRAPPNGVRRVSNLWGWLGPVLSVRFCAVGPRGVRVHIRRTSLRHCP